MTFPLKVKLSHRRDKVRSERAREGETEKVKKSDVLK